MRTGWRRLPGRGGVAGRRPGPGWRPGAAGRAFFNTHVNGQTCSPVPCFSKDHGKNDLAPGGALAFPWCDSRCKHCSPAVGVRSAATRAEQGLGGRSRVKSVRPGSPSRSAHPAYASSPVPCPLLPPLCRPGNQAPCFRGALFSSTGCDGNPGVLASSPWLRRPPSVPGSLQRGGPCALAGLLRGRRLADPPHLQRE